MTFELGAQPGRPRDVRGGKWFVDHPDGTVSYVVRRREEGGAPSGAEYAFHAATDAEARAEYDAWSAGQYERVVRMSQRRAKWGPTGTGRMR